MVEYLKGNENSAFELFELIDPGAHSSLVLPQRLPPLVLFTTHDSQG